MTTYKDKIPVEHFCRRYDLTKHNLFVLAHRHPVLLPPVIDAGGSLRIGKGSGMQSIYEGLSEFDENTPAGTGEAVSIEDFCDENDIGHEALLRLVLRGDHPAPARFGDRLAFPARNVRAWEDRKRREALGGAA